MSYKLGRYKRHKCPNIARSVNDKMGGWWTALDAVCLLQPQQHQQFPVGAYCWVDADKAQQREQVVSIEGNRKEEKPGRGTPSVRKKITTKNYNNLCSVFILSNFSAQGLLL